MNNLISHGYLFREGRGNKCLKEKKPRLYAVSNIFLNSKSIIAIPNTLHVIHILE